MADPVTAAIAAIGAEIGGTVGATMIMYSGQIAIAITAAATIGASSAYSSQQKRKARNAYNASLKDREVMIRSAVAPRRIIYGRDKVSGPIVYAESTGDKGQYLHLVIALASHECDAIEEIWFNDVLLPTPDAGGFITSGQFARGVPHSETETVTTSAGGVATLSHTADAVNVVTRQTAVESGGDGGGAWTITEQLHGWAHVPGATTITGLPVSTEVYVTYEWTEGVPVVRIKKHLGGAGQVADADLVAESAGGWTAAHVGAGITYLYARLEYDQEVFGQVGLPNISAVVRGKKVRDPRTGLTVWSDNAALCIADWLQNTEMGFAATAGQVPDSEVTAAANICDETIDLELGGATTQKRYVFNGSFTSDIAPRDALADLLSGMAGQCVWTQGRWLVRAGAYRAPSLTITADHLAGRGLSIVPKATRSELYNAVRAVYRDPLQLWAEVQAPLVTNAMYEAEDGGRRRVRTIQLPGAMDHWRAQRLAKIELERGRQCLTVQCTTNLRAYDLSPTDTATLQLTRYGWSGGKVFEVADRTWSPDGTLQYTGRETAAGIWAWNFGEATVVDLAPDTELPNPYLPPAAITGLTLVSGSAHILRLSDGSIVVRVLASWDAVADVFVVHGGRIELQYKQDTQTEWQATPPMQGDAVSSYAGPMQHGHVVLVRVRAVNASGRSGPWTTAPILATGKLTAPSDVTGLAYEIKPGQVAITWNHCPDSDYSETELRYGATWAASLLLWVGAGREYQHPRPPNGVYTVWSVHRDTSGNISAAPAPIDITVDDSIDGTVTPGAVLRLEPRREIILPIDQDLNVITYQDAWTDASMIEGAADLTAAWTLTAEFLNCTGTFTANRVVVSTIGTLGLVTSNPSSDVSAAIAGQGWSVHGVGNVTWGGDQWWLLNSTSAGGAVVTGIVTSPDFTNFTGRPTGVSGRWNFGAYGAGKFVSVESVATGATTRVLYSSDGGATFSTATIGAAFTISSAWSSLIYGDRFMCTGNGTTTGYQSADGVAWTSYTLPSSGLQLTHGEGSTYAAWKGNELWISTNGGTSWSSNLFSAIGLPAGNFVVAVLRFRGRWIVVPQNAVSELYVSTTGGAGTWVRVATPFAMRSLLLVAQVVNNVLYLICHDSGGGAERMLHTTDGLSFKAGGYDPTFPIFTNAVGFISTGYNLPYLAAMGTSLLARRINLTYTSESSASVTVRANKAGEVEQVAEIQVHKGSPPSTDVYTYSAYPVPLEFQTTADGVVLSYTGKSITLQARKNGVDDNAAHTFTWVSSNAGIVPTSGSGTTITVTSFATALTSGSYTVTITKPGLPVRTEAVPLSKAVGSIFGGLQAGRGFADISHVGSSMTLRFQPDGRMQLQKDAGAFTDIDYWALPVSASYAANTFMKFEFVSGDALSAGSASTGVWHDFSTVRDLVLSRGVTGFYQTNVRVFISQPTAGANPVFGTGTLELIVP